MSNIADPFAGIDDVPVEPPKRTKKVKSIKQSKVEPLKVEMTEEKPIEQVTSVKEKATLIFAIQAYGKSERFGKFLKQSGKKFNVTQLNKMNVETLKLELESLDLLICSRGNNDFIDMLVKNGLTLGENVVHERSKMKVRGTTEELYRNDRFLDLVERVKLKYGLPSVQLDPALELSLVVFQTALCVHQSNQFKDNLPAVNLDEIVPNIEIVPKKEKKTKNKQ